MGPTTKRCPSCGLELSPGTLTCPRDGTPLPLPAEALLGQTLGPFRVEEEIGRGGMGIVYRGVQEKIGKTVAVKVLRPELASDPEQVERLLSEARAVNAIGHRNIVDIFYFGELPDGRHYVVMEYLRGTSLRGIIDERAPLPPEDALPMLEEIASALSAAHSAGVVHRDLKPSNVFVVVQADGTRYLKLLDFGLAKQGTTPGVAIPQTRGSRVVGTPGYMAPEQARGEPVSPRTDLYALGVIAFELLTGEPPFRGESDLDEIMLHLERPAPAPSSRVDSLPEDVDRLVLSMLEKEPSQRPESAEALRRQISWVRKQLSQAATRVVRGAGPPIDPPPPKKQVDPNAKTQPLRLSMEATAEMPRPSFEPTVSLKGQPAVGHGLSATVVRPRADVLASGSAPPEPAPAAAPVAEQRPGRSRGLVMGLGLLGALLAASLAWVLTR